MEYWKETGCFELRCVLNEWKSSQILPLIKSNYSSNWVRFPSTPLVLTWSSSYFSTKFSIFQNYSINPINYWSDVDNCSANHPSSGNSIVGYHFSCSLTNLANTSISNSYTTLILSSVRSRKLPNRWLFKHRLET